MDFTLSNAPEYVIKNIKTLQQIRQERCDVIENNVKGVYSRHFLLILSDLREEIHNNKNRFSENAYGKKFFKIQFATYCSFKKEQIDELDRIKKSWSKEVNQELYFVTEALSDNNNKFELDDISILIERIEHKLTSEDSFGQVLEILYENLLKKDLNDNHIEFFVDTIIILFNAKGMLELKLILDHQFQKFEDIATYPEQGNLYPTLFGSPLREAKSIDEHKEELRKYYEASSIKQRLNFLREIYCLETQIYKVIFKITGVDFTNKINIGNVELYRPKIDGQYIKTNDILTRDFEDKSHYCVAVDIRGSDSKFMRIKAQQMAERTIAGLSTRNRKYQAIILSNHWVICDSQGEVKAFSFKGMDNKHTIRDNSISQNNRQRLGQWISSEKICHPTVAKWLASIDWYRQATEASQSSEEILNSWFAVEKFSDDSKILSKRFPKLSEKLSKNKTFNETIDLWLKGDGIRTVQLLLALSELKWLS